MSHIPENIDPHLDVIKEKIGGGVYLGASSLSGPKWLGSLWYFADGDSAPNWEKCTAGAALESGICDLCCVTEDRVVLALDSGSVQWWRLQESEHTFEKITSHAHDDAAMSVDVAARRQQVVSGSRDMRVIVWDVEGDQLTHSYRGHAGPVSCVACHPSEPELFLSASEDGRLLVWDLRTPKPARAVDISQLDCIPTCVAWQPGAEAMSFAVGTQSGDVALVDTRAPGPVIRHSHERQVNRVAFSPCDARSVASVADDCTAAVTLFTPDGPADRVRDSRHTDFVRGVTWVGEKLYTCGWDSQVFQVFNVDIKEADMKEEIANGEWPALGS